ncbi:MAG: acid phosphatase [Pseudomonadota bacterium]|nr:acid phosphatase [Pseudomonadota bacterium]
MRLAISFLSAALLAGCVSVATHGDPSAALPPPNDDLNATVWFQTSVERDLVFRQIYGAAGAHLDDALADKSWDALPKGDRSNDPAGLPPAIIVDVDETVLDNSPEQVRQIVDNKAFNDEDWNAWVQQASARPLPGAVEFLTAAAEKGVTVFYISNREAAQAAATVANLRSAGFPIADASQFLGKGTRVEGCAGTGSAKDCRRQRVGREYRVLMQFGDQLGDLVHTSDNTPSGRQAAIAPYLAWVGERWWVLPNPMYGSWEPALFGNDWSLSPGQQRAAKEAALDDMR